MIRPASSGDIEKSEVAENLSFRLYPLFYSVGLWFRLIQRYPFSKRDVFIKNIHG